MKKLGPISISFGFILSVSILTIPSPLDGQSQTTSATSKVVSENATNIISVSASIAIQVGNETLKTKENMLRGAVVNFLNSGPNILKTPSNDLPIIKTNIANRINKATQSVEGIEATNAIVGVEISKALRTIVSSMNQQNQTGVVTVETTSRCAPSNTNLTSCSNTVTIK
jgi:hypothetical protein